MSFKLIDAAPRLTGEMRAKLASAILAATFVVAAVELQRHWGGESTGIYVALLALIGIVGIGALWQQKQVVVDVGWLIDFIVLVQVAGGLLLVGSGSKSSGGELLREAAFWAPLVCAWWALFHSGSLASVIVRAALLYGLLFIGGGLDIPDRHAHELILQGALAIGLMTMALGLLAKHPESFAADAAFFEALSHDQSTGLASRVAFEAELEHVSVLADRQEQVYSVILLRVEGLSEATDDATLRNVAAAIFDGLRRSDTICRWRENEFMVLLPGTGLDEARMVAGKIAAAVTALRDSRGAAWSIRHACEAHRQGEDATFGIASVEAQLGTKSP